MGSKARTTSLPTIDDSLHPGVLAAFQFEQRSKKSGWYTSPIAAPFKSAVQARVKRGDTPQVASLLSQAEVCLDHSYLAGGYGAAVEILEQAHEIATEHFEVQYLLIWTLERLAVEVQDIAITSRMRLPAANLIEHCDPSASDKHRRAVAFACYATASLILNNANSDSEADKALALGKKAHELRGDAKFLETIETRCLGRKALLRGIAGDAEGFEELGQAVRNFSESPLGPEVMHPTFVAYLRERGLKKADAYVNAYGWRGVLGRAALARTQLAKGASADSSDFESFIKLGDVAGIELYLKHSDFRASSSEKEDFLKTSVSEGTLATTEFLVEHGFPPYQGLMNHVTRVDIAQYLKDQGFVANAEALTSSVRGGYREVVRFFVSLGVDPNKKAKGKSAVDMARKAGDKELLEILSSEPVTLGLDLSFVRKALKSNVSFYKKHPLGNHDLAIQVEHLVEAAKVRGVESLDELVAFIFDQGQHDVAWVFAHAAAEHFTSGEVHKSVSNKAAFIIGDVRLEGNLDFSHPIIIAGDLRVTGSIIDGEPDSMLIVSGKVEARNIVSDGSFFVAGDMTADEVIFGHYNHGTLAVGGRVKGRAVVMDDHHFECKAKPETALFVADARQLEDKEREALVKAFGDECLADDYINDRFFIDGARQGKTLFRG